MLRLGCALMRGKINSVARKQQINDFSGLRYGKITPTDIDGVIEYKDRATVFIEVKYAGARLPFGQRLALQRLVNDVAAAGKRAIAIVADHDVHDTGDSIPVADCKVREFCLCNETVWRPPKKRTTVREMIDEFLQAI